jgi:digeranylgeranylglycerophospholipid reductase
VEYLMKNVETEPGIIKFYFGKSFIPRGYVWIFPKSKRHAVGIGCGQLCKNRTDAMTSQEYLDRFVDKYYPGGAIKETICGILPANGTLKNLVAGNFLLVGDAAHQVNPLSGGGIMNALEASSIAGETIARGLKKGDLSKRYLSRYLREWHRQVGRYHYIHLKLRNWLIRCNDREISRVFGLANKLIAGRKREDFLKIRFWLGVLRYLPALLPRIMKMIG